jgi:para-nitrobenzyl esterase
MHEKRMKDVLHVVPVEAGFVEGVPVGEVVVFRGVPFADRVDGAWRFQPARPAAHWDGVRDASRHGPIAPQLRSRLATVMGEIAERQDENCLTLTLWTPNLRGPRRPVLVFLHGGGNISGAGSIDWYDGRTLCASGDLVVACINYRLGALGYLQGDTDAPLSMGLEDQRLALQWIYRNVAAFGGDPEQITVAGQSAGAVSIAHLLRDPMTGARVKRVILQSGGFGRPPLRHSDSLRVRRLFVEELAAAAVVADERALLRDAPMRRVLEAQANAAKRSGLSMVFSPVVEDGFGLDAHIEAMREACRKIPVMIGITADEGNAYIDAIESDEKRIAEMMDRQGGAECFARYTRRHPGISPVMLFARFMSDTVFARGCFQFARALSTNPLGCYAYLFDWCPRASRYGACHSIELPFVFGNFENWRHAGMLDGGDPDEMVPLSREVQAQWIHFIRTGRPASASWQPFNLDSLNVHRFGLTGTQADPAKVADWIADDRASIA